MNPSQEALRDRIEITFHTDARLTSSERSKYENRIRTNLSVDGVEVGDIIFRDGSTIVTVTIFAVTGLGLLLSGALQRLGERSADWIVSLLTKKRDSSDPLTMPKTEFPSITTPKLPISPFPVQLDESGEPVILATAIVKTWRDLPGKDVGLSVFTSWVNLETQERVEQFIQIRKSKL